MSAGALLFLVASWVAMLGLTAWSFARVLRSGAGHSGSQDQAPPAENDGTSAPTSTKEIS